MFMCEQWVRLIGLAPSTVILKHLPTQTKKGKTYSNKKNHTNTALSVQQSYSVKNIV